MGDLDDDVQRTRGGLLSTRRVLIGALLVHVGLAAVYGLQSPNPAFDFDRYYEIASAPGRPYLDHAAEHPIATVAIFRALAHLPGGRLGFGLGVVALDVLADAIIVGALLWGWGEAAAVVFAVVLIFVLDLFFNRIDPWSVAAATFAMAAWRRGAPRGLGAALALGVGFKLWPLVLAGAVFAPPANVPDQPRFRREALGAFVAFGALLAGLTLIFAGWGAIGQVVTFRGARGWQIEGLVGSVIHLAGAAPRFESGSWRIGASSGPISVALFSVAAPLGVWSSWRGARTAQLGAGWLSAVALLLLFSALLSAQYVIWLIPGAAIAWSEGDRAATYLTALVVALTCGFWSFFPAVLAGRTPALALVVVRNLVLLAIAIRALRRLGHACPVGGPIGVSS
jgi:hypothetical protein